VLIDVVMIVGLGAISIISKNDLFFKVKPAIIEMIMVVFLIGLALAPDNFIMSYIGRFMPQGRELLPAAIPIMKRMFIAMAIYTTLHAGAVWYTALHSSRKTWAIVSGPGYYLIFIPIMGTILWKRFRGRKES
jgi:intracellular septation protein A